MMKNYEAVARMLAQSGVDTVFGLVGNGNLELVAELVDQHRVAYLSARHENAAVAAADGFARAGGRTGIATVTHGPGLTNALTALVTAYRARTPLLLIAGNATANTGRSTQKLEQSRVVSSLGVPVFAAGVADDWAYITEQALAAAREGAVMLDLQAAALGSVARSTVVRKKVADVPDAVVDAGRVDEIAAHLQSAQRPVIVAGRGAMRAGVRDALVELASRVGAHLGTSLVGKGLFAGVPGDIGIVGGLARPYSVAACEACDLLLAVGASLNGFTTEDATLFRSAVVIRLDQDAAAPSSIPIDLTLPGPPAPALAAILTKVGVKARPRWAVPTSTPLVARNWPSRVAETINRMLPAERTVVYDHGAIANELFPFFDATHPSQSIFMPDFGSLGLAVASGIGAATARPERRTVVIVGDGGLMMSLAELDTLKRSGRPVLVVVFNDGAYGAEYPHLKRLGGSLAPATFDSAPLADVATALGVRSMTLREGADLSGLADIVRDTSRPALVEVVCSPPV